MRWMWIDRVIAFEPRKRLVAVKNVSLAEEHLHQHFAAEGALPPCPVMPSSLILEGMAQTAGILVGSVHDFREKVVLAKVVSAVIERDINPGETIRYDAVLERMDDMGASTVGTVDRFSFADNAWAPVGRIELMFSHLDQNRAGTEFPEENFVFGENFRTLLEGAGLRKAGVSSAG
jgi:3-hydroxyacyl-[acyl-carrier-protein] dehydratase